MLFAKRNNHEGFTLIELIIVIVILGILAVVAVPKFIGFSTDARATAVRQMASSLTAASELVYIKAVLNGMTEGEHSIDVGGSVVEAHSGYPRGIISGYAVALDIGVIDFLMTGESCARDWCSLGNRTTVPSGSISTTAGRIGKLIPRGFQYSDECGVYYLNEEDGSKPTIGVEIDEC